MGTNVLRGAISIEKDSEDEINSAVKELLETLFLKNGIREEDISFALFSHTHDIKKKNSAKAARDAGFLTKAALFCVQEAEIENAEPMIIRILILLNRTIEPHMVYLKRARKLRGDIET